MMIEILSSAVLVLIGMGVLARIAVQVLQQAGFSIVIIDRRIGRTPRRWSESAEPIGLAEPERLAPKKSARPR